MGYILAHKFAIVNTSLYSWVMESYVDIKNFKGLYSISTTGRVYSHVRMEHLKPYLTRGYPMVVLISNKTRRAMYVHRLVCEAFVPNPVNKPCVNHKDLNKTNNTVENLEWCTYRENNLHSIMMQPELHKHKNRKTPRETIDELSPGELSKYYRHIADGVLPEIALYSIL